MKTRRLFLLGAASLCSVATLILWSPSSPSTALAGEGAADAAASPLPPQPAAILPDATPAPLESRPERPDLARLEAFDAWLEDWNAASPEARAGMETEGVKLASDRRAAFKALIATDPRQALARAVSRVSRQDLPEEITAQLETPVSAQGEFGVKITCDCQTDPSAGDGHEPGHHSLTERFFTVDGVTYKARVSGELESLTSRKSAPLQGVVIDDEMAVAANAVRRIEPGERIPAGAVVEPHGAGDTGKLNVVEIAGRWISVGSDEEVVALEEDFNGWVHFEYGGSNSAGFFHENFPNPTAKRIGNYRLLYIRVNFPDVLSTNHTEESAEAQARELERIYGEWSYGKLVCTTTITPVVTMPWSRASGNEDVSPYAQDAVRKLGYDPGQYDTVVICADGFGGVSFWNTAIVGGSLNTILHEVGHQLGAWHASGWSHWPAPGVWSAGDGTGYGWVGSNNDTYGNPFDIMGNYGIPDERAHFGVMNKLMLGWLAPQDVHRVTNSGSYRIHAFDQPVLEQGKRYGIAAAKDRFLNYYLEYRPSLGGRLEDSALVHLGDEKSEPRLVDTTPHTPASSNLAKREGGIAVGRTFSDLEADMHFTVVSKNATTPPSLDIVYKRGPFPGNQAPVLDAIVPSAIDIAAGGSITFDASAAADADGDALAYHWDFGDGMSLPNSAVVTRTFASAAQVTAMVTVSDMKGGTVRRHVVVNVGNHGKQTVTGTITSGGQPLENVYVTGPGGSYAFTDRSGNYALSNLATGNTTLTATFNGHALVPSFASPLNVVAGANVANWTATASWTFVTLSKIADASEGGANGSFRFTRTGSTAESLVVRVAEPGASAAIASDYTLSPDRTVDGSGKFWNFTIPAGQASLDVSVTAVNDTIAEGPEALRLHLSLNGSYLPGAAGAMVMTLHDNDTALPQVAVAASHPYAAEFPADPGSVTFTRTGSTAAALEIPVAWSGTATNGTDHAVLPAVVTIPAGQSSATLTVAPTNDSDIESAETVIASILASPAYVIASTANTATVELSDDDVPMVTVSVPDASASESGPDSGLFLIQRSGSTAAPLKVYYGVRGSAVHGTDYASLPGEIVIPAGARSAPVLLSPVDDGASEVTETVVLAVAAVTNTYSLGTEFQGTVKISDNEGVPAINVRSGVIGTEGGANATVTFRSTGSGTGNVTVRYTVSGTATPGADFAALPGSLVIPAGGLNDVTLTIPILNDAEQEATERVVITLVPDDGYRIEHGGSADALIRDNDSGGERVNAAVANFASPSEAGPVSGRFHFSRTNSAADLVVNYGLSGTATNGVDYVNLPGTVTIPAGQTGVFVDVTPINDTVAEGIETVTLAVLPGAGYSPEALGADTLAIADNEVLATTVGFQSALTMTSELPGATGEFRDIEVRLSAASLSPVTVEVVAGTGTSAHGDNADWAFVDASNNDALLPAATLAFAPGEISRQVRIRVKNDGMAEPVEMISLRLHSPRGATLSPTASQHQVFLYDGAVPSISTLVTEERWNNGNVYSNNTWATVPPDYTGRLAGFTPARDVGNNFSRRLTGLITAPATGTYTFWIASDDASKLFISTDATAANKVQRANVTGWTGRQNWTAFPSQQSVPLSLVAGQSYYVEVQHQEGSGDDHVSVAWEGPGFGLREILSAMPDDAPRTVRFALETSTRVEADGAEPGLVVFLDRPAGPGGVTVNLTVDGSAAVGSDFTLAAGNLVFAPGESSKNVPLAVHADGQAEGPEWIRVSLANPAGAQVTAPSSHTITLQDGTAPVIGTLFTMAHSTMAAGTDLGGLVATPAPGLEIAGWTIVAGNTGDAFAISPTGRLTLATPGALPNPGGAQLIVRATDSAGSTGDGVVNVVCNAMSNGVVEERWDGTAAYAGDTWSNPQFTGMLAALTTPQGIGDNYSRRLVSYLKPAVTGDYFFNIAGDDHCRLLLSTDESAGNAVQIAAVNGWTPFQSWDTQPGQRSGAIPLVAGRYYRIEVRHQEMTGGDHVSVAWEGPGIARQPVPSSALFTPGGVTEQRWTGTQAFDFNQWSGLPAYSGSLANFTAARNVGDGYSRRLTGYLKPAVSGDYSFWIAGDDDCRLYLGSDASPSGKSKIAAVSGATGYQLWDADRSSVNQVQQSETIPLVAGRYYWMEVHHKEGAGDDHVSVAWQRAGGDREVIPADVIFPTLPGLDFDSPAVPPVIALTSPSAGGEFEAGDDMAIAAMVTGGSMPVDAVEFYRGATLIGSDSSAPYTATWNNIPTGSHVLTAKAVFSGGGVTSSAVTVSVVDPDPAADPDGDGFTTGLELTLGTHPHSAASQPDSSYAGLVAWWKLDDAVGTLANDATGRPQDGAVAGAAWASGVEQGALTFDGLDDQVEVPASLLSGRSGFSVSGWFRTVNGAVAWRGLFGQNDAVELGIDNHQIKVWTAGGGGLVTAPMPAVGQWHHVACVADGTSVKLYVDGLLANTGGSPTSNYGTSTYPFRIGGGVWGSGGGYFAGDIDDVRIYARPLSAAEVLGLRGEFLENRAPAFASDPVVKTAAAEDTAYTASLAADAGDPDSGDTRTFIKVSGPAWLGVATNGALSGTPANADVGPNSFTVRVTDAAGLSDDATLTIAVTNRNDAPVFAADPMSGSDATEDSAYSGSLAGSAGDVDAGDTLTYSMVSGPGWLTVATNGVLSGTPGNGDAGPNSFIVRVTDGGGLTDEATFSLTVINVNDAPAFAADPIAGTGATEDSPYIGSVTAADIDAGDPLTFTKASGPAWLTVAANGSLSGTPSNADVGPNSFTVRVTDGAGAFDEAVLNIAVANVNDAPVFTLDPIPREGGTEEVAYTGTSLAGLAVDADAGDTVTYSKVSGPAWLAVAGNGALSGTPPAGSAGSNAFVVRATDGTGAFDEAALTVEIIGFSLPLPWDDLDVGGGIAAGSATHASGVYAVVGAGNLGGRNDAFHYVHQPLSGDGEIIARINALQDTGTSSRVGVMIRDTLATNSRHVFMGMTDDNDYRWVRRTSTNGNASSTSSGTGTVPNAWVRLTRTGNTITAYKSGNGTSWIQVGSLNAAFPVNCYIGLVVASGTSGGLNASEFNQVNVTP